MANALTPEALVKLVALKKQARNFLILFKNMDRNAPEFQQYRAKYDAVRDLFSELSLIDLSGAPATVSDTAPKEEEPKTKKEKRKARREARRAKRKNKRAEKVEKRKVKKAKRQKQKADKDGTKEEANFRLQEVTNFWNARKFDEITEGIRAYLEEAKQFLVKADNYVSFAEMFAPEEHKDSIATVKEWIEKAKKFLAIAQNVSDEVDRYADIFADVITVISELPAEVEEIKGDIITRATQVFAAAKQFLATADSASGDFDIDKLQEKLAQGQSRLDGLSSVIGLVLEDKDKNNLPDWFDKIEKQYKEILEGKDFIPGTDIDDKILLQISNLNDNLKDFIAKTSDKVEELKLQDKIDQAKKWLDETSQFISAITGFVENIKDGDLSKIYEDIKNFKDFMDNNGNVFSGTDIDDKFMRMLSENSKKAEDWLMNKLSGGDDDRKSEIKAILGSIDKLILSGGGTVDHTMHYGKDENEIKIPEITALTPDQKSDLMKEYGFNPNKEYDSLERVLGKVTIDSMKTKGLITDKYKTFLTFGANASKEFKLARYHYDQAVKAHKDYLKAKQELVVSLIKGIVGGVASLVNPALGAVVRAVGDAILGDMTALNDKIKSALPDGFKFVGDLASGVIGSVLPKFGVEEGLISEGEESFMKGLTDLYSNGITAKYTEVYHLLDQIEGQANTLQQNLISLDQADGIEAEKLKEINNDILILAQKFKVLRGRIQTKYLDLEKPSVNTGAAYFNASRYLHSAWIVKNPSNKFDIGDSMVKSWKDFKIMDEAKVDWGGGNVLKNAGNCVGIDTYGRKAKIQKLKKWAFKEQDILKTQAAWTRM